MAVILHCSEFLCNICRGSGAGRVREGGEEGGEEDGEYQGQVEGEGRGGRARP